jgi:hypothetical protein
MGRRLTPADALSSWRVDGELRGGHTVEETLSFIDALQDVEDERSPLPMGVISPDGVEPRWLGRLRRWTGRG